MSGQPLLYRVRRALLVMLLLWFGVAGAALAARTVVSVTIDGVTVGAGGSASVAPNAPMTVVVTLNLSGSRWRSTRFSTSGVCRNEGNFNTDGIFSQEYLNVPAPATPGTYNLTFTSFENPNCQGTAFIHTVPNAIIVTHPRVLSIVRNGASPTNAGTVSWTVTFNRAVTGGDFNDIVLVNSGLIGPAVIGGGGSGTTYTVTASTGTGSGTLGLNLVDDNSIRDVNNLPLGGSAVGDGNFTGQVYTIDRQAPLIPAATMSSNNAVSAAFAKPGDIVTVAFTTSDANGVENPVVTIGGVAATLAGGPTSWTASRVMTGADAEGPVAFTINVRDTAGNAATPRTAVTSGVAVTFDRTAPVATITCANPAVCGPTSPTSATQVVWNVTFSEAVTGVSVNKFALSGTATTGASIASVTGSGASYSVTVNTGMPGTLGLNFTQNLSGVNDRAGNNPAGTSAVASNTYTIGNCAVLGSGGCTFDAVESGAAPATAIFTKRVGATIRLDILALSGPAIINTSSNASVQATLVEASNDASCGSVAVSATMAVTYVPANAGRVTVVFAPTRAARDVRVKITSGTTVVGCSADNFSVRPDAYAITPSAPLADADLTGANPATTAPSSKLKAGAGLFGISAQSANGYTGTPLINNNRLQASVGTRGAISGVFGSGSPTTGLASGAAFTYSEVGYVRILDWGIYDNSFTAVDSAKSPAECFSDTAVGGAGMPADPNLANASGKYGCYFGSNQSAYFGRFIPAHFALSAGAIVNRSALASCAASTFTYMGEPMNASFTLTAQNAANATTVNYTGSYARLNLTNLGLAAIDDPAAPTARTRLPVCAVPAVHPCLTPGLATGDFTNGVATGIAAPLTIHRASAPAAPFSALKVGVAPVDDDLVRIASFNLDTTNVVSTTFDHRLVGATIARWGRMSIDNAYGSELLNLSVRITAQYWNGAAFLANALDNCTPLEAAGFSITGQSGGITAARMNMSNFVPGVALTGGVGKIKLSKPLPVPTSKGQATLNSTRLYLPGKGRATFGVYKAGPVIYVRETY